MYHHTTLRGLYTTKKQGTAGAATKSKGARPPAPTTPPLLGPALSAPTKPKAPSLPAVRSRAVLAFPTRADVPESWIGQTPSVPDAGLREFASGGAAVVHSDALRRVHELAKHQSRLHTVSVTMQDSIKESIRLLGDAVTAHINLTQAEASISILLSTLTIHTGRALERAIAEEQEKKIELNRRFASAARTHPDDEPDGPDAS